MTSSARAELRRAARGWRWGKRPLVPRSAERFAPPAERREFPTDWARTPLARTVRHGIQTYGLDPLVRSQIRARVSGLELLDDLPEPVIFVANHTSHLDTPLILCSLPAGLRRRTSVAAAADYFFDAWWRAVGSAMAFSAFPIERRAGRGVTGTASELLAAGENLVVFPEGTRSHDGWVGEFRRGAAMLAVRHGAPIVPVGIRGSYAAMPRGRNWPRPGRPEVHVRFGRPISPAQQDARSLTGRLYDEIAVLVDEDAADWWTAQRRLAAGATPSLRGPDVAHWRRVWASTESPAAPRRVRVWHEEKGRSG